LGAAQRTENVRCFLTTLGNLWGDVGNELAAVAAQEKAACKDALDTTIAVMQAHLEAAPIQAAGCHVLCSAIVKHDTGVAAGAAGAVKAALAGLAAYPGDLNVTSNAMDALAIVCRCPANEAAAFAAGALKAVVVALRAFPGSDSIQSACCRLLHDWAEHAPQRQAVMGVSGGIEAAVAALRAHPSNDTVQSEACEALAYMTHAHEGNAARAADAGAIDAIVDALRRARRQPLAAGSRNASLESALVALHALLDGPLASAPPMLAREALALAAGALEALSGPVHVPAGSTEARLLRELLVVMNQAAERHDTNVCHHMAKCARCAAARETGAMCALPSCAARCRADDTGKGLLRCGRGRRAAYCGAEHQKEDWKRHKRQECSAAPA
jgi:hypothetical protein